MRKKDFEFLLQILKENAGWKFSEEQYFIIEKKIGSFIRGKNYSSIEDLINELKMGNHNLISQTVEAMAFSETMFFRDAEIFSDFKNIILPKLKDKCRARKEMDVWSLGCSSGQETYSIAIIFDKCQKEFQGWKINISGSDMSGIAVNKAQRGVYNNFEIQTGLSARDIINYFDNNGDQWQAKDFLRKMIDFRRYNMLDEITGQTKFEVVFCRNVLRYFDEEHQDAILSRINLHQPQGGYLVLGKNEKIPAIERYYYPSPDMNDVYLSIGKQQENIKKGNISISAPVKDDEQPQQMPSFARPKNLI